jgi:uncharacterized protein (DUF1330 family)
MLATRSIGEDHMSKGYWVGAYRSISDPTALASYAKLAGPAVEAAGGRFLARGGTVKTHEAGVNERTVIVEFASFELAQAAYESEAYKEAVAALGGGAVRDVRIVEGVD